MSDKEQISNLFIENWTSVFNTILGKDVNVVIDPIETLQTSEIPGKSDSFESFVSINYGESDGEKIVFLTGNKLISIVSNLMIGLDSFSDEINDDDKDAFTEGLNQMFSSCQVPIKENLGLDMNFHEMVFIDKENIQSNFIGTEVNVWKVNVELPEISSETFLLMTPIEFGTTAVVEAEDSFISDEPAKAEAPAGREAIPVDVPDYSGTNFDLILDVELPITIRIGSTEKKLIEIMRLGLGSIIELEKVVDDPVEVLVNNKLVARGEVVVLDSNFAIRIISVESKAKRIQSLR